MYIFKFLLRHVSCHRFVCNVHTYVYIYIYIYMYINIYIYTYMHVCRCICTFISISTNLISTSIFLLMRHVSCHRFVCNKHSYKRIHIHVYICIYIYIYICICICISTSIDLSICISKSTSTSHEQTYINKICTWQELRRRRWRLRFARCARPARHGAHTPKKTNSKVCI